jgi:DNA-binding XRE family transcriptional regulator
MSTQPHQHRVPAWTVGDRLRKAREESGLSQQELADAIGVSRNTISNHEVGVGKRDPQTLLVRAWAAATDVSVEWIRTGHEPPLVAPPSRSTRRAQAVKRSDTALMQKRYHGHVPNPRRSTVPGNELLKSAA